MELLRKTKVEKEFRKVECEGMLNIQPLVIKLSLHSSSSLECIEGKAYNEKIQFTQTTIHDIDTIGTSVVEFLCKNKRRWHAREQTRLGATLVDLVFINLWKHKHIEGHMGREHC
jgi:hypothetical protein